MDINSKKALLNHRKKIREKSFLHRIYLDFYQEFKSATLPKGKIVELGSGAGFIKDVLPNVTTSDVIKGPDIDLVFFADKMPFKSNSVGAFLMIDVLHHIKNPEKAFSEMSRCLKRGGKIIMIEPFISVWGSIIYKYFHPEKRGYNDKGGWVIEGSGRMSDANPAMSWIIFKRDKELFQEKFPKLKLMRFLPHTPFKYLISGGLSDVQLLPVAFYPAVSTLEKLLSRFNKVIGMFVTIELKKV